MSDSTTAGRFSMTADILLTMAPEAYRDFDTNLTREQLCTLTPDAYRKLIDDSSAPMRPPIFDATSEETRPTTARRMMDIVDRFGQNSRMTASLPASQRLTYKFP